jgi:citrate lyase beta subunit
MLEKSLLSSADSICYDLEDAVAPGKKADARTAVCDLLDVGHFFTYHVDCTPLKSDMVGE